jgi:pyridoxine kinase
MRVTDAFGTTITDLPTLHTALHRLHTENSLSHIAFSSIPLRQETVQRLGLPNPPQSYTNLLPDNLPEAYNAVEWNNPDHEVLVCFASSWSDSGLETWAFALPTILVPFTGTGDFLSALVAAWYDPSASSNGMSPLATALSKALLTVQQILLRTHIHALAQVTDTNDASKDDVKSKAQILRKRELRIIPERSLITDGGEGWPGSRVDWSNWA